MSEHDDGFKYATEQWLASELQKIQRDAPWSQMTSNEGIDPSVEVRLQVANGNAYARQGSSDYDQDHAGYWGAGCVNQDDSFDVLLIIARDLIDQALDMQADSGDCE